MSQLSKFLRRLSPEMLGMGRALLTLASGVALQSNERREVEEAANKFITGAENIMAGIDKIKDSAGLTEAQVKKLAKAEAEATFKQLMKKTEPGT